MNPYKRSSDHNQQIATAIRPQLPRDGSRDGINKIKDQMPPGLVTVWSFEDRNTKDSGYQRGVGKKVY